MKPLHFGMIGGGQNAFIGAVHRTAAIMDGQARFVAGALSSTPERSLASGRELGLDLGRNYPSWAAMLEGELARPAPDRIDFVSIVTPNHAHFEPALAFVQAGFHVVLDKPMVMNSQQAAALQLAVQKSGVVFAVTYNYTGYPLVRAAAELIRSGALGTIRKVFVEYHQGWLATRLEAQGQKQADWRTDPARAGAGALGDIGTHAENLVSTITGLEIQSLCADVSTLVPGRAIDDDAAILLRFKGGARGLLSCSQICTGEENNLSIRIYATDGTLSWRQENPNELWHTPLNEQPRRITRNGPHAGPAAALLSRLPAGHPEGFYEAFANIYRAVFAAIHAQRTSSSPVPTHNTYPGVDEGARGVRFIERALESARLGSTWVTF